MSETSPNLDYFKWINGTNNESRNFISRDMNNNVYVIGSSKSSSITINNTSYSRNASLTYGLYIVKFNTSGNVVWLKWFEANNDLSNELIIASPYSNYIYITATAPTTNTSVSNNGTTYATSSNTNNSFILKMSTSGDISWLKFLITNGGNYVYSSTIDISGNLYLGGVAFANNPSSLQFNGNSYSKTPGQDGYIMKINSDDSVNFIRWIISSNGSAENVKNIIVDSNQNIYVSLYLYNTSSFSIDNNTYYMDISNNYIYGSFLIKFNSNNTLAWINNITGISDTLVSDIKLDNENNIILLGNTSASSIKIKSNTYTKTISSTSVYVTKFDNNGNIIKFIWIDGVSAEDSGLIAIDTNNNIYITGYSVSGSLNINDVSYNKVSGATKNSFVIKFNTSLQLKWIEWITGTYYNNVKIILSSSNEVYLAGVTNLTSLKFKGVTYTKTGTDDATFIIKLKSLDMIYDINFIVNEFISLNQNVYIASNAPQVTLNIDYSMSLQVNSLNSLFPVSYQQNISNSELYDIDISMNPILLESYLSNNTNNWNINKINSSVITTGLTTSNYLPQAILETIALRVFGSGNARAAITNDKSIDTEVLSHKNDFLSVLTNHKDELFRSYVDSGRINGGDVSQSQLMNFTNTHISFPMWVTGSILNPSGSTLNIYPYSDGYMSYNGYGSMNNGLYNIPIIVKFYQN